MPVQRPATPRHTSPVAAITNDEARIGAAGAWKEGVAGMAEAKKIARNVETGTKKAVRGADGTSMKDRVGNTGDTIRKDLGNTGDAMRDTAKKAKG
jgi:hypothetical protein